MTTIYLVRHGQTSWNREEVFRGRADISLNETGRKEAHLTGEYLREVKVDSVYSSPLSRAVKTAEAIARYQAREVRVLDGLIDIDLGQWQGVSHEKVRERYGELYRQWKDTPHLVRFPGGESLEEVRERALRVIHEAIPDHTDETLVMVSHRVVNKIVLCGLLGLDNSHFWQIGQDTGCINILEFGEGFTLRRLNDTSHLVAIEGDRVRIDF
ncbi:MAG: histidine phosphatase family protein [Syntrophobacterales bacterium]|nr:MAG: histidine phosphatase family protein [Syntrophobacterales bacterium]